MTIIAYCLSANAQQNSFTAACTPPLQPSALILTAFPNLVTGVFIPPVVPGSGYLVIRTNVPAAPLAPVNGVVYTAGTSALGGYVESVGSATSFTSTGLLPGTQYYYWVYSYSTFLTCAPISYNTAAPLTNVVSTLLCGLIGNNVILPETGSVVWTSLLFNLGHLPTGCEDVTITLNGILPLDLTVNLSINSDVYVHNLTLVNTSLSGTNDKIFKLIVQPGAHLYISGDLILQGAGVRGADSVVLVSTGGTFITGNATIGLAGDISPTAIGAAGAATDQTTTIGGDLTFNSKSSVYDKRSLFIMNGTGAQSIVNNSSAAGGKKILFDKLRIGDAVNNPTVTMSGSNGDLYMNDNGGSLRVSTGATMIMPAGYTFNAKDIATAGVYNSSLLLDNNSTLKVAGNTGGYTGSNFPANYTTNTINSSGIVEYNGSNAVTQTVYNGVTYGNLVLSNGSGSGRAQKINTGAVVTNNSVGVNALTDLTLGAAFSSAGAFTVYTAAGLYCATNVISGAGAFTLQSAATLGMGHVQGITAGTVATGNIQVAGGRNFSIAANYLYNGIAAQVTGNGLPATCNDLTLDNPATVTIANSETVTGINLLKQGVFDIGTNKMTITGTGTLVSTLGKMKANLGLLDLNGSAGTPQTLDGSWFVNKTISTLINSNTTGITVAATAGDSLLIASGLLYGPSTTNSAIGTNNNVTLLSRDTATARFGEIKAGSNNTITGTVTVERFISSGRKWRHLSWPVNAAQTAAQSWMENNNTVNGNSKPGYGTIVTDDNNTWSINGFDSKSVSGPSIKFYNSATNSYTGIPNTSLFPLNSQPAYYVYVRGDRSCVPANSNLSATILRSTGALRTGDQTFAVPANQFAAIGNPYASAIDLRGLDTVNLTTTFYVWDPKLTGTYGQGAYQTVFTMGADYRVLPGGGSYGSFGTPVDTLESGQAFFVRGKATAGSVTFKESAKTIGARTMSRQYDATPVAYAILNLMDSGTPTIVDGAMAAFDHLYSNAVDYDDALKMPNTSENASFKRENTLLAIERRQNITQDDTLFLNITGMRVHQYQWDINTENMSAVGRTGWVVDSYLNTSTQLTLDATSSIVFDVTSDPASYAINRFMIVFKQAGVLPVRFSSISASRNADKTVTVQYHTQTELNMQQYNIQYSADGTHFTKIGTQLPTANNGGSASYNYVDGHATAAVNYYRVEGKSINGQLQYTAIVKVAPLSETAALSIYPNPVVKGIVNIRYANQAKGAYTVTVINEAGQTIRSEKIKIDNPGTTAIIQLDENTAKGTYHALITDEAGKMQSTGFVIL